MTDIYEEDTVVGGTKWSKDATLKNLPNNFIPRFYQQNAWDNILTPHLDYHNRQEEAKAKGEAFSEPPPSWSTKMIQVLHRRAGKDIGALHMIAIASQLRVGKYFHLLPFKTQARDAIWNGMDSLGNRFIQNAFPPEMVSKINENSMRVTFKNGSTYQLLGSDTDKLVGAGCCGVIYSESSLMAPTVRTYLRPMLDETGGWELHIATPRGKNHFFKLCMFAETSDEWYYDFLTIRDTWRWAYFSEEKGLDNDVIHQQIQGEITFSDISEVPTAIKEGRVKDMYKVRIMTDRMVTDLVDEGQDPSIVKQEYYCDWEVALAGAYYADLMGRMAEENRIGIFKHNTNKPVYVHMDIGFNDLTSITFAQAGVNGNAIVINHLQGSGKSLLDWVYEVEKLANEKGYLIALIVLPHDAKQTEVSTGITRMNYVLEQGNFEQRGLTFEVLDRADKQAGIDAARAVLVDTCIDESCEQLIESLKAYRRKWDDKNQTYSNSAVHDWASHSADNFRYLASSWEYCVNFGYSADRLRRGNDIKARITMNGAYTNKRKRR